MKVQTDRAKEYSRKKQMLRLFNLAFTPLLLIAAVMTPLSWKLQETALAVSANPYAVVFLYFALFSLYCLVFDLPLTYYSGFYLEHCYGLSNQTFLQWIKELIKKSILSFVLSAVLILALYALIWRFPGSWWLYAWGGYAAVSYLLGKIFPVVIVPLFYQYGSLHDDVLRERLLAMAAKYGMQAKDVYSINLSKTTKKANAAFMGIGKTKRIVLSDTLLENFTHDEIEMVIAHELGHFKHKDIWRQLALGLISSLAAFAAAFYLMPGLTVFFGTGGTSDVTALPVLFLVFYVFGVGLMPLQNAFSRYLERQADRFALQASAHTNAFISCMEKLGTVNLSDPDPHPAYEWFFYDHPSIKKRVKAAQAFLCALLFLTAAVPVLNAAADRENGQEELKRRQKTEWMRFYRQNPKDAEVPQTGMSVEFFNQAVSFFKSQEYDLARQALEDSIRLNDRNSFAYELLGDIAQIEHDLKNAKAYYTKAYLLKPAPELQEKFEKVNRELSLDDQFLSEETEHFVFKYKVDEKEDIRALGVRLEEIYENLAKEFGEQVRRKIVVILYEPEEFSQVTELPHWVSGVYDGKIRLPVYSLSFGRYNLEAIAAHEMTHAFVSEMSDGKAPSWINEGLAEYEEGNYEEKDLIVFRAAVRTNTLLEIDHLMNESRVVKEQDPLFANLFYVQSYELVSYMIERYGMFEIKQLLKSFGQGKNYDEAIREVLKTDPLQLEADWKSSVMSGSR